MLTCKLAVQLILEKIELHGQPVKLLRDRGEAGNAYFFGGERGRI